MSGHECLSGLAWPFQCDPLASKWDTICSFGDDLVLGFKVICCFGFTTGSLLSATLYLKCTFCTVSLLLSTTHTLLLLLAPAKPASADSNFCLSLSLGLLRTSARAPHYVCRALVNEEFCIGTLITKWPGAVQEIQVLFLYKHFEFGLAEYLDTNSLWVEIP